MASSGSRTRPIRFCVARSELACPVCDADLPLGGDERLGDQVFCSYCGAPSLIRVRSGDDEEEWELEEDF